jgi:hypothetical protein
MMTELPQGTSGTTEQITLAIALRSGYMRIPMNMFITPLFDWQRSLRNMESNSS